MKSSKTTPTHELSEIITQPNMKFDVYEYMVIRKEFLNFLANVNGLLVEARKAFELLLAKQLEEANRFDERQNADGNFATFEERAWKHLLQIIIEKNRKGGENLRFIGNFSIVTIYQYWEENTRSQIAKVFSVESS